MFSTIHLWATGLVLIGLASGQLTLGETNHVRGLVQLTGEPDSVQELLGESVSLATVNNPSTAKTNLDTTSLNLPSINTTTGSLRNTLGQKLRQTGMRVFMVEGEEPSTYVQRGSLEDQQYTLNSDVISFLLGERIFSSSQQFPAFKVQWVEDGEQNDLSLHRMQLGLPGRSVWLVHENDEEEAMSGVQLKKSW